MDRHTVRNCSCPDYVIVIGHHQGLRVQWSVYPVVAAVLWLFLRSQSQHLLVRICAAIWGRHRAHMGLIWCVQAQLGP